MGIIFSIIAGMAMSIQGVMNTRLSEKIGIYESNLFVQGTAFLLSIVMSLIMGLRGFSSLEAVNKVYLFGGAVGLLITITVMLGIKSLSPTVSISIILASQLIVAAIIDSFGLMSTEKIPMSWSKFIGIALLIAGVLMIKIKK